MNPTLHECGRIVTGTQLVNENDLNDLCLAFMMRSKRNMSKEHTIICIWAWHPVTALQIAHRRKGGHDRVGDDLRTAAATSESVGWQNVARFRLYRLRFLQENMRFAAFFKIYQII
jgi:hypothetical protein